MNSFFFTCLGFLTNFLCSSSELLIRGVPPENNPFYIPSESFTCLDKSASHPWSRVNDDYCDCRDGSDEPGTPACSNMKFYCENKGHQSRYIPSSFVNDQVCDCCDGSDEYFGYIECPNTCGMLASEREAHLSRKREEVEKGHEIYKEYVVRKAIELEQLALREAQEKDEKERLEAKAERARLQDEAEQQAMEAAEPKLEPEVTESPAPSGDQSAVPVVSVPSEDVTSVETSMENNDEGHEDDPVSENTVSEESIPSPSVPPKTIDFGPENGFMMLQEVPNGCLEVEDKEYVYALCAFKDAYQRSRGSGPTGGTLLGTWHAWANHPEGSETWEKEAKMQLPYGEMLYGNGASCWNGPNRSVKVKIICGSENKLLSAEEPSRCTYLFRVQTPAACHRHPDELFEHMHSEL